MNWKQTAVALGLAVLGLAGQANAEGRLNIYNWGNYTNPELIKKFEEKYKVKVTLTDYDSNDTALAKIRQGGAGFDIVVPSGSVLPIWIKEGLLLESRPDQMENFKNVDPRWVDMPFDHGRRYSVPWQWGTTGVAVNASLYKGDPNTSAIFLDPPPELVGKINVVPEMSDIMPLAIYYVGGTQCTDDKSVLRKARDVLVAAKPKWRAMDYPKTGDFAKGELGAQVMWSGAALRDRALSSNVVFGYPKEGYPVWMDNAAILKDAKNVENAKLFLNFIMAPENAALISSFAGYANGIVGSEAFMPDNMKEAPEIRTPARFIDKGRFAIACPPEVQALYTRIWTDLLK